MEVHVSDEVIFWLTVVGLVWVAAGVALGVLVCAMARCGKREDERLAEMVERERARYMGGGSA